MEACDFINNGRHLASLFCILPIRNQVKTARNSDFFFVLYMTNNTEISHSHDFSQKIYFYY